MTTAEQIINNQTDASILSQCLDHNGIVRESGYGFEIYQFTDESVLVELDHGLTAYPNLGAIAHATK